MTFGFAKRAAVAAALLSGSIFITHSASACDYHWFLGLTEPTGIWPTDNTFSTATTPATAMAAVQQQDLANDAAVDSVINFATGAATPAATPVPDATVTHWLINTTNLKGKSTNTTINNAISGISANVQQVRYTSTNTYIKVTSIPDYNIGPFNGNPNVPANANATFDITHTPAVQAGAKTATGGGAIGVLLNGVEVFNAWDGTSYNNQNTWHPNAGKAEAPSFDSANGHPQQQGVYHNHESPSSLLSELNQSNTSFSPIIGYAIDGYPIYGNYASTNADGTGSIVRMTSSYQLRSITDRHTLADGTQLASNKWGPAIDAAHPLGYYQEDYQYVAGTGTLDQYNGRTVVTPDYPQGTYAYFASTDSTGAPAYPYFVGPSYYGVVQTDDLPNSTITVPADSVVYSVPEPSSVGLLIGGLLLMIRKRRM